MNPFRRSAEETLARDVIFVALAGFMLMVAFSFAWPMAFNSGATVALLFSVALILRALWLTEEQVPQLEAWRRLDPAERPDDDAGRRMARDHFEELLLRTAKAAAVIAICFYSTALVAEAAGI